MIEDLIINIINQNEKHTYRQMVRLADGRTDGQTSQQTDRLANRRTDGQTSQQTVRHRHINMHAPQLYFTECSL